MPHSPEEKRKAIARLRRIRGQAQALEGAIEKGSECGHILQQLAALRGAVNGMIVEILDGHMRETFDPGNGLSSASAEDMRKNLDEALSLIKSYLK